MTDPTRDTDGDPELDARYRQALRADGERPSAAVRAAILTEAAAVAARARAGADAAPPSAGLAPAAKPQVAAANDSRWRLPALAVAAVIAVLIARPLLETRPVVMAPLTPPAAPAAPAPSAIADAIDRAPPPAGFASGSPAAANAPAAPAPDRAGAARVAAAARTAPAMATREALLPPARVAAVPQPAPAELDFGAPLAAQAPPVLMAKPSAAAGAIASDSARAERRAEAAAPDLLRAVAAGDVDAARSALGRLPQADVTDERGRTALWLATDAQSEALVRLLLAQGADPNRADRDGVTPLSVARRRHAAALITLLEGAGAH